MGSSQPPPNPFLPFGYSVDADQEPDQEPAPEPPEHAPGAPLLTDNDTRFLSSFFDSINSNQYNVASFGEGLVFSDPWLNLPPQFMGTTTSFGQQPGSTLVSPPDHAANEQLDLLRALPGHELMPPPPPPPSLGSSSSLQLPVSHAQAFTPVNPHPSSSSHHSQHSEDVLNAAATLMQNGNAARLNSFSDPAASPSRRHAGPPASHLQHQPLEEFKEDSRRGASASATTNAPENTFADWMYGAPELRGPRSAPVAPYAWGSDPNFNPLQAYTPAESKETLESMHQEQLKVLEAFKAAPSAPTTRAPSPTNGYEAPPAGAQSLKASNVSRREDMAAPPSKRRKSRNKMEDEEEAVVDDGDEDAEAPKPARRRKLKQERPPPTAAPATDESEDTGTSGKRRKSAVGGARPQRENLTEEQKRENHIRSEQKRRTLIKVGFEDMCELVPGLRGGGFSKSTMLTMAASWLEAVVQGNEELAAQLEKLEQQ
ncbi:hypothetical protein B0I35DRAFT_477671 [Stachybotrys elegans]|uniref:BHLH domain-containing protein n=1 Tax=Stachybotrys elegans TaxID=80388 RepID=A0A8K0WST0_9HYPO|nr:hypothetical protein B0I35DRAFT_477671 [Stachybotrys elegans]